MAADYGNVGLQMVGGRGHAVSTDRYQIIRSLTRPGYAVQGTYNAKRKLKNEGVDFLEHNSRQT